MDPSTWMSVGLGGLGLLKGMTADKDKERRDRELAAVTAQYSPWTGMKPGEVKEADPFGAAAQGAGAGFGQGQQMMQANKQQDMQQQYLDIKRHQAGLPPLKAEG